MNNQSIALNVLQVEDQEKISHFYKSEFSNIRQKQVILLMITDIEKQNSKRSPHYLAVKRLSSLLKKD